MLKTPELVPFRLTRDMIDGMGGSQNLNGIFKHCCEHTLRVMRNNYQQILTVLDVLVHDPLYKWTLSTDKIQQLRPQNDDKLKQQQEQYNQATMSISTASTRGNNNNATRSTTPYFINSSPQSSPDINMSDSNESGNAAAKRAISLVRSKLGLGSSESNISDLGSLSIEGQVQYLINEATDRHKLAYMYYGWAAWV